MIFNKSPESSIDNGNEIVVQEVLGINLVPIIEEVKPKFVGYSYNTGDKIKFGRRDFDSYLSSRNSFGFSSIAYVLQRSEREAALKIATCPVQNHDIAITSMFAQNKITEEDALVLSDFSQGRFFLQLAGNLKSGFYLYYKGGVCVLNPKEITIFSYLFGSFKGGGLLSKSQEYKIKKWLHRQNIEISKKSQEFYERNHQRSIKGMVIGESLEEEYLTSDDI